MGTFIRVLAVLALIAVLVGIGAGIYNAGVSAGLAGSVVTADPSGAPVVYYPGPYVGQGWDWGPGWIFGIFFWILGIFLIFALLRAAFGWGRWSHGYRDWDKHRPNGSGGRREHFEEWHRRLHDSDSDSPGGGQPASGT